MAIEFLDLLDVLEIHEALLTAYGGKSGIRDVGLLQSALAMPQAGSKDQYYHQDLYAMAAAYLFHIIQNHPFFDGNKRTALAAALVFLDLNGIEIDATDEEALYSMVIAAAEGKSNKETIAHYFRNAL